MAMYRILLLCFLLLSFIQFSHASDFDDVKTRVNQLQTSNPSLPSGGEQKGTVGTIISKIFDTGGYIQTEFLRVSDIVSSVFTFWTDDAWKILKWNGTEVEVSKISEDQYWNMTIDGNTRIVGNTSIAGDIFLNNPNRFFAYGAIDLSGSQKSNGVYVSNINTATNYSYGNGIYVTDITASNSAHGINIEYLSGDNNVGGANISHIDGNNVTGTNIEYLDGESNVKGMNMEYIWYNTNSKSSLWTVKWISIDNIWNTSALKTYWIYIGSNLVGQSSSDTYAIYQWWEQNNYFSGNTGIWTFSPTEKLDVAWNIKADGNIYLENNGSNIYMQGTPVMVYDMTVGDYGFGWIVQPLNSFFAGPDAGKNATGGQKTALGVSSAENASGFNQTSVWLYSGYKNQWNFNTQIGAWSGFTYDANGEYPNTGYHQTAVWFQSGAWNTANSQVVVWSAAGLKNTWSSQSALWFNAGRGNTWNNQTIIGYQSGYNNIWGNQTAIGFQAGHTNTGNNTSTLGYRAGYQNTWSNITALGYQAGYQNTGNDVVAIGYRAGEANTSANKFIVLQRSVSATPLIQWDFSTGFVGIGKTDATEKLDVNGNVKATSFIGNLTGNATTATTATSATTATTLQTARNINGIAFNGSADITLPTVNTSDNQTVAGQKTFSSQLIANLWIKVGDTSVTCGAGQAGLIRFNATTSTFEWCTGSAWVALH